MKHTQGIWKVAMNGKQVWANNNMTICTMNADLDMKEGEFIENARLIAEVGTVLNETGKTPKQLASIVNELMAEIVELKCKYKPLAESNAELLEALKCAYNVCKSTYPLFNEWVEDKVISEAINKASLTK